MVPSVRLFIIVLAVAFSATLAAPYDQSATSFLDACELPKAPILPTEDCFYTPPPNWETKNPGDVLRWRLAPGSPVFVGLRLGGGQGTQEGYLAYNILFRTTDSNEKPAHAVTTVILPRSMSSPPAIVGYQDHYNSANVNDCPSYKVHGDVIENASLIFPVVMFLQRGWFVNLPDFEGSQAAFGAGHMSGYATLDSMRATLRMSQVFGIPRGADLGVKYALYGYSGGSFATAWAAELQPTYASDLSFVAAGMGGLFPNATDTFLRLASLTKNPTFDSNLRNVIVGIGNMHEDAQSIFVSALYNQGCALANQTWKDIADGLLNGKISKSCVKKATTEALSSPIIINVLDSDTSLGHHGVPRMPLMIHRAEDDQLSTTEASEILKNEYCRQGGSVFLHVHHLNTTDPHTSEGEKAIMQIPNFLDTAFKGTLYPGCGRMDRAWEDEVYGPVCSGVHC